VLRKLYDEDCHVKVIRFRRNFGQSAALYAGFDHAKGDIIITLDADLQNDPKDIPNLLKKLEEGYDLVCGWRYQRKDPLSKRIPSKISNWLARQVFGLGLHDLGCTLRVYKKETIRDLEIYGETHRYIPALIAWKGFRVTEVKVQHHPRKHGKTKYGFTRLVKGFIDMLTVKFLSSYLSRPAHIFGFSGIMLLIAGFIIGSYLLFIRFFYATPIADRPLLLLSILLFIMGIQLLSIGLVGEVTSRIFYSIKQAKPYSISKILEHKM
jgi:glycosyltransferase involved in cell wall biosynthesis